MTYTCLRRAGAVCLSVLLLLVPTPALTAGSGAALGTAQGEGPFFLSDQAVESTSVVFSGDQVRTGKARATVSFKRSGVVVVGRDSTVRFLSAEPSTTVALDKGRLALSTSPANPVRVESSGLAVTPSASFPALAEIALGPDGSLVVAVRRGSFSVAQLRGELVEVAAGQVLTVNAPLARADNGSAQGGESQGGTAQTAQSEPVGTGAHGKMTVGEKLRTFRIGGLSHNASVALIVGVVGGATAAAIAIPLALDDEAPVSPSQP